MPKRGTWEVRGGWVVGALMADLGLRDIHAAAVVGNLGFESAGFTRLQEVSPIAGRGGYGWAQWTASRRIAFETWTQQNSLDSASDEANYRFLLLELGSSRKHDLEQTQKTTTLEAAVFTFGYYFERPAGTTKDHLPGFDGRLKYAQRALSAIPTPAPPPVADVLAQRVEYLINLVEKNIMATLQDIKDAVAAEKTVEDSLIKLLDSIEQQLKDAIAANDPAAMQAIVDDINANKQAMADAVAANTPAAP